MPHWDATSSFLWSVFRFFFSTFAHRLHRLHTSERYASSLCKKGVHERRSSGGNGMAERWSREDDKNKPPENKQKSSSLKREPFFPSRKWIIWTNLINFLGESTLDLYLQLVGSTLGSTPWPRMLGSLASLKVYNSIWGFRILNLYKSSSWWWRSADRILAGGVDPTNKFVSKEIVARLQVLMIWKEMDNLLSIAR